MSVISTSALLNSALSNIQTNQNQLSKLSNQLASQKVSTNLAGYGNQTAQLTTLNSTAAQLTSYVNNAQTLSDSLATQNTALTQFNGAAQGALSAIQTALGQDDGTTLMATLQSQLTTAASALNTQVNGQYIFSGGQVNTPPVANSTLQNLNTSADVTSSFQNGQVITSSRLDSNTVVQTGQLASDIGTPLYNAMQAVQAFNDGPDGPLTNSPLTTAQQTFLSGVETQFQSALTASTNAQAENGVVQAQVSTAQTNLGDQQTAIQGVISNLTVPDGGELATQITLAQTALQASAEVFQGLQSDSLLTLLTGQ